MASEVARPNCGVVGCSALAEGIGDNITVIGVFVCHPCLWKAHDLVREGRMNAVASMVGIRLPVGAQLQLEARTAMATVDGTGVGERR